MNTESKALSGPILVAIDAASNKLSTCMPADVPALLDPLHGAWIDAVEEGDEVDVDMVAAAFPRLRPEIADAAEAVIDAISANASAHTPAMIRFAEAHPVRCLAGLRELSYEAGRGGDAFYAWQSEAITAIAIVMRVKEGPIPPRLSRILAILESAFFAGREVAGIDDDPSRRITEFYLARRAEAREAADERLADAIGSEELAAELRREFSLLDGDALDIVEEAVREAALRGELRAAQLRIKSQRETHEWFVRHADELEKEGRATRWVQSKRDESARALRELGQ